MKTEQTDYKTWAISEKLAPTPAQRDMLKARGRELVEHLKPTDGALAANVIGALISRMLMSFPSYRANITDADREIAQYVENLADTPLWAVHQACAGYQRGEYGGSTEFPPSAASLSAKARSLAYPFRMELEQIKRILNAQIYHEPTQEERDRVIARFQSVLAETIAPPVDESPHAATLHAGAQPAPAPPSPAARVHAAPPNVSPALRAKLGIPEGVSP
ncbi:hypothetical protein ACUSIJ_28850 [Pseudochelatococcus sp. B33]